MTAPTLPRQRTQRADCPYCEHPVPGLMISCNQPTCVTQEIDEIVRTERRYEDG